jgi:hypothetical protein
VDALLVSLVFHVEIVARDDSKISIYSPNSGVKPGQKPASLPRLKPHSLRRAFAVSDAGTLGRLRSLHGGGRSERARDAGDILYALRYVRGAAIRALRNLPRLQSNPARP